MSNIVLIVLIVEGIDQPIGPFNTKEEARIWADSALPSKNCKPVQCVPPC